MNYFNPYPLCVDNTVTTAWKSQIAHAAKTPSLAELLAQRGNELFPRFAAAYSELRALPRGARRALQRRLAHSRELSAVLQEWFNQQSGRALQQKLATTLAGAALLLVLGRGASDAATITVNTTVPGIAADGKCSLIEAIINANNNALTHPDCLVAGDPDPTADTIVLPKKTFTLTTPSEYYYGYTGLPLITSKITIEGNGAKIARKKSAPAFRHMAVSYYSGDLELRNLTLSGGQGSLPYGGGGAIVNGGQLTITGCTLTGNVAPYGGAIANYGNLTITNSALSKNTANGAYPSGGFGGGIANGSTGIFTIANNSTITGNKASYYGGGVANSGNFNIDASTISKNSAPYGGGFANFGGVSPTQTISNSTISGNKTILKNITYGGYSYTIGGIGAGIANLYSTLTITNSTISGNIAKGKRLRSYPYFAGGLAGGILNFGSSSNLTLSGGMVTKNTATFAGGGLLNFQGTYTYTPGTITGNKAKYGPNIYNVP